MPAQPYYVLVTGGRNYDQQAVVDRVLDGELNGVGDLTGRRMVLVQGGANGADRLAKAWAMRNKVAYVNVYAEWELLGKRAGHARNEQMLDWFPIDRCVAFPGGAGTADMCRRCDLAMVPVLRVYE